ncbi:hypothetical protein GCM10011351_12920 [Paraliobacillus quinghaiensis]|uniref:Regulatory protein YycH-like domain-containing protein n=1 Tax=Paraliobacillus quinghaiensis TaxID=470815 RepID=A0A917WSQ5_9BACI|nr:two-component system regulatory protein YycI [Paraliobacillus quinghaiensis]GGM28399.1 hypothetical protein GCM10011351_12920 [Paraliobacillus quinghaiensis]
MQWGQIKSLFIICFFILNIFLVQQLLDKRDENQSFIPEESSKEEELRLNINGLGNVSEESFEAPLIYAKNKSLSDQSIAQIEQFSNQKNAIINDTVMFGQFNEPVAINMNNEEAYKETLSRVIVNSGDYMFWGKDERSGLLIFFQVMDYPIYYNTNALLLIQVNDDSEMLQYVQTSLEIEEETVETKDLIPQIDAVSNLYHKANELRTGDEVNDINLGYHNLISLPNGEQVLNPTWNVKVNKTKEYFVNAIEGHNYPQNNDFLRTSIINYQELLQNTNESNFQFIHVEEAEEKSKLLNMIKDDLTVVYNRIIGVENE